MKSRYDIYEFREVKDTDECASYNIGLYAPILVKYFEGEKWCCYWQGNRVFEYDEYQQGLLTLRKTKNKCYTATKEYTKRRNDITPLGVWK